MADYNYPAYDFTADDLQNFLTVDDLIFDMSCSASQQSSSPSQTSSTDISCTAPGCGCGQIFRRRSELKKHVDRRTRPYACPHMAECGVRAFTNTHDRDRHQLEVHGESGGPAAATRPVVKLRCPVPTCKRHARGFGRKENLALHVRNMHPAGTMAAVALEERRGAAADALMAAGPATAEAYPTTVPPFAVSSAPAATSGSSSGASDAALLAGLQDRLEAFQARRGTLAAQMAEVDGQIDAVARTIAGWQSLQGLPAGWDEPMGWASDEMRMGLGFGADGLPF